MRSNPLTKGKGTKSSRPCRRGLSLIEVIVAVAVLFILLSIFVPYLLKVREESNRSRCADNLRMLGGALADYAARAGGDFPRVVYNPAVASSGYAAFTGPDAPNPFAKNSAVSPNDVTASLWLLVRLKLAQPADFICPSTTDFADTLTDATGKPVGLNDRSNFRSPRSLSFSYACPFGTAPGYRLNDTRRAGFALMADRAPDLSKLDALAAVDAPPLQMMPMNSANHRRAGQNVLYAQGDVEFESTPYCGVDHDNIYTATVRPLAKGVLVRADDPGVHGVGFSPGSATDSFLVPAAGDPVGQPIGQPATSRPAPPTTGPTTRPATRPTTAPATRPTTAPSTTRPASTRPAESHPATQPVVRRSTTAAAPSPPTTAATLPPPRLPVRSPATQLHPANPTTTPSRASG